MKGEPSYSNLGGVPLQLTPEVSIDGSWKDLGATGAIPEMSWSNNVLDLSKLDSISKVRLSFKARFDLTDYSKAYSANNVLTDVKFVVRQWNVPSRTRRLHGPGLCSKDTKAASLSCALDHVIIDLSEFSGEIELQPLVLATKKMRDRHRSSADAKIEVQRASILGWTDPLTIVLDRSRNGLDSLFEFRWVSFKNDGVPGLTDSEFFAMRWHARPILYLNKDIEGLYEVLSCEDKTGKRARARDSINSTIAHQCLSVAITSSVYAAREIHLGSHDSDPESVEDRLSALERLILREWVHVLDPDSESRRGDWAESLVRLLTMTEDEVQRAIADLMPQNLQAELGSAKAVSELLKTFMERTGEA